MMRCIAKVWPTPSKIGIRERRRPNFVPAAVLWCHTNRLVIAARCWLGKLPNNALRAGYYIRFPETQVKHSD